MRALWRWRTDGRRAPFTVRRGDSALHPLSAAVEEVAVGNGTCGECAPAAGSAARGANGSDAVAFWRGALSGALAAAGAATAGAAAAGRAAKANPLAGMGGSEPGLEWGLNASNACKAVCSLKGFMDPAAGAGAAVGVDSKLTLVRVGAPVGLFEASEAGGLDLARAIRRLKVGVNGELTRQVFTPVPLAVNILSRDAILLPRLSRGRIIRAGAFAR